MRISSFAFVVFLTTQSALTLSMASGQGNASKPAPPPVINSLDLTVGADRSTLAGRMAGEWVGAEL
jgi:hypothetical protein